MLSYVEHYEPTYFLLENVAGFLDHKFYNTRETKSGEIESEIQFGMVKFVMRTLIALGFVSCLPKRLNYSWQHILSTATKPTSSCCSQDSMEFHRVEIESSFGLPNAVFHCPNFPFLSMHFLKQSIGSDCLQETLLTLLLGAKFLLNFIILHPSSQELSMMLLVTWYAIDHWKAFSCWLWLCSHVLTGMNLCSIWI